MASDVHLLEILLVEDDLIDREHTRGLLERTKIRNRLHAVSDGVRAIQFLRKQPPYSRAPTPDLILLDLHLPRMTGEEVLRTMAEDEALRDLPVVLQTGHPCGPIFERVRDKVRCVLEKPLDLGQFVRIVESFDQFGLALVRTPPVRAAEPPAEAGSDRGRFAVAGSPPTDGPAAGGS